MDEREWIESISKFECSDGRTLKFSDEFIKDKYVPTDGICKYCFEKIWFELVR